VAHSRRPKSDDWHSSERLRSPEGSGNSRYRTPPSEKKRPKTKTSSFQDVQSPGSNRSPPEQNGKRGDSRYRTPSAKKRSKGSKSSFEELPTPGSRKSSSRQKQKHSDSDEDLPSPRKPAAVHKTQHESDKDANNSPLKTAEKSQERPSVTNYSNSPGEEKAIEQNERSDVGNSAQDIRTKEDEAAIHATDKSNHSSGSVNEKANSTKDPLYWLAGGENSSDDESWDFDGPMILPPPPL